MSLKIGSKVQVKETCKCIDSFKEVMGKITKASTTVTNKGHFWMEFDEPIKAYSCTQTGTWVTPEDVNVFWNGEKTVKIALVCSCCLDEAPAYIQWYNRDEGYGICAKCVPFCKEGETDESFKKSYGINGIHYFSADKLF